MLSIEEAWAALNYIGPQIEERVAARAYGLAVLDAAHSHPGLYRCNCTTWAEGDRCREYRTDLARIRALGKEETE